MADNKNAERATYALVQILFDKLEERDRRNAALEAENAELIRKLAKRLFKDPDNG